MTDEETRKPPSHRSLRHPEQRTELPKGRPRTWYWAAVLGIVLALSATGLGIGQTGVLDFVLRGVATVGILLALTALGIAITKERAIKALAVNQERPKRLQE